MSDSEPLTFWKNLSLVTAFFVLAPLTLCLSIFSLVNLEATPSAPKAESATPRAGVQLYASLPSNFPSISDEIEVKDARVEIIKQYMESYKSPLTPYAAKIVEIADKYSLSYKLIPAIAQQESNLCKRIPPGSHNCWGWGIHSASNLGFDSYEEAIETVTAGLKANYIDKGYTTVEEIMSKYTPHSPNGAWAKGVSQFMAAME